MVGISLKLIEALLKKFPNTIAGIKDSSGDWNNTQQMLNEKWDDFGIFAGSESFLLKTMQQGGAGCISATANINPGKYIMYLKIGRNPMRLICKRKLIGSDLSCKNTR